MKVALLQVPLVWENQTANRNYLYDKLALLDADLVLLPEMFSTGFTMHPERVAEKMSGSTVRWMQAVALEFNIAVGGSAVIEEDSKFYNRFLFVRPCGTIEYYDKRHLFTLAGEHEKYTSGKVPLIVAYKGWKICFQICYDLRFPVFSRNTQHYDLLVYVANWPKIRIAAWDALLKARAIENVCYVAAVNRIGIDGNGHQYTGHSQLIDAVGNYIIEPIENENSAVVNISKQSLQDIRSKFAFLDDQDRFTVLD